MIKKLAGLRSGAHRHGPDSDSISSQGAEPTPGSKFKAPKSQSLLFRLRLIRNKDGKIDTAHIHKTKHSYGTLNTSSADTISMGSWPPSTLNTSISEGHEDSYPLQIAQKSVASQPIEPPAQSTRLQVGALSIHRTTSHGENGHDVVPTTSGLASGVHPLPVPTSLGPGSFAAQQEPPADPLKESFPTTIRIGTDCFIALHLEINSDLILEFERSIKAKVRAFLQHLRLQDARISLDCAMASRTTAVNSFKPTILIICFNDGQKKAIERRIEGQRNLIPASFVCRVVVQEIRLVSTSLPGLSDPAAILGQVVEAKLDSHSITLCSVEARLAASKDSNFQPRGTIGGIIRVDNSLYALAAGHSFTGGLHRISTTPSPDSQESKFQTLGRIHSYKFAKLAGTCHAADQSEPSTTQSPAAYSDVYSDTYDENAWSSNDWALVELPQNMPMRNICMELHGSRPVPVEGHFGCHELRPGPVWVCSSSHGVIGGFLNETEGSIMIESGTFSVRAIALGRELEDGDSGSWVIRNGKVCGYIFTRVVGCELAFMLPIDSVFDDIRRTLGLDELASVDVPSYAKIQSLVSDMALGGVSAPSAVQLPRQALHQAVSTKRTGNSPEEIKSTVVNIKDIETKSHSLLDNRPSFTSTAFTSTASSGLLEGPSLGDLGNFGSAEAVVGSTDSKYPPIEDQPAIAPASQGYEKNTDGWPIAVSFLGECDSFGMFRTFGQLHSRLLLQAQTSIIELERKLDALEKNDETEGVPADWKLQSTLPGTGPNSTKKGLLRHLESEIVAYDRLLLSYQKLRGLPQPDSRDLQSLSKWIRVNKPLGLTDDQLAWIYHPEDMVSLVHAQRSRVKNALRYLYALKNPLLKTILKTRNRPPQDFSVMYYSANRLVEFLVVFLTALVLSPNFPCYFDLHDSTWVDYCWFHFFALLTTMSDATVQEILIRTTTYCAVLTTFLGNFQK